MTPSPALPARFSPNGACTGRAPAAWFLFGAVGVVLAGALSARAEESSAAAEAYAGSIRPLVLKYCGECHGDQLAEAELNLAAFQTAEDLRRRPAAWQRVDEMLASGQMPPKDSAQPTVAERQTLAGWVRTFLSEEARATAGDPGPVILRRLTNAEYTYTVGDLTGLADLEPAREFPVDGAAGEGFTNTGAALVMSPALLSKYFEAAKQIAAHAVLLPDGFRFAPGTTRQDWTNELVAEIRGLYAGYADAEGRVPLEKYLAIIAKHEPQWLELEPEAVSAAIAREAKQAALSRPYLEQLWQTFSVIPEPGMLQSLVVHWQQRKHRDVPAAVAEIRRWQQALVRFQNVGHMKRWQEPVNPLRSKVELRWKAPSSPVDPADPSAVTVTLSAGTAGDGHGDDWLVWRRPRLVAPGRPELLLRDVRHTSQRLLSQRRQLLESTAACLAAVAQTPPSPTPGQVADLAKQHQVPEEFLVAWLAYLGFTADQRPVVQGHFTERQERVSGYDFVTGWGSNDTPNLAANSSDQDVRIPGNLPAHRVAVHPSPSLRAAVGWQSPVTGLVRVSSAVTHAHPECGNGVEWNLEVRRGPTRQSLGSGISHGGQPVVFGPTEPLAVRPGDVVSLLIGPRDGNHACDLTLVDLEIRAEGQEGPAWNLAAEVSPRVTAANPHADAQGNPGVWHFYTEPIEATQGPSIPAGSLLARWLSETDPAVRGDLAQQLTQLVAADQPPAEAGPDAELVRQLRSLTGPLLGALPAPADAPIDAPADAGQPAAGRGNEAPWGLAPEQFGNIDGEPTLDPESIWVRAPSVITVRLPRDLVAGAELVVEGELDLDAGLEGSVQLQLLDAPTADNLERLPGVPIVIVPGSETERWLTEACDRFRQLFPPAVCYPQVVPVDEVITLTLYHREDEHLARLLLEPDERARLDRLWQELRYVSADALKTVDAFAQLMEYATQDSDPGLFEPMREPIQERAAAYRQQLRDTEPAQLAELVAWAPRVYRRPLVQGEAEGLQALYDQLRAEELSHDEAFRLTLARLLIAPDFLYRLEKPGPTDQPSDVSAWELASRLSYFLWSTMPDESLWQSAAAGRLTDPAELLAQTRRMLANQRARHLAEEFACQWLQIRDFDQLDEKSESHFPTFSAVRGLMYEESLRYFTDFFQNDGSVLDLIDGDHTFVNAPLAEHYGIPGIEGDQWRKLEGARQYGRGSVLGLGTVLAKQSGASRTSPILRGNWVSEVLLGERLPRPPKGVPPLPDDESATAGLTVRQLVEKHRSLAQCAVCHDRIDAFGIALEEFDAIGRHRTTDLGNRPIDTRTTLPDGQAIDGAAGLRAYLAAQRQEQIVAQFCRKLLGYALGRSVQLSDLTLIEHMADQLAQHDYRISAAVEAVVLSPQFRQIRGQAFPVDEHEAAQ